MKISISCSAFPAKYKHLSTEYVVGDEKFSQKVYKFGGSELSVIPNLRNFIRDMGNRSYEFRRKTSLFQRIDPLLSFGVYDDVERKEVRINIRDYVLKVWDLCQQNRLDNSSTKDVQLLTETNLEGWDSFNELSDSYKKNTPQSLSIALSVVMEYVGTHRLMKNVQVYNIFLFRIADLIIQYIDDRLMEQKAKKRKPESSGKTRLQSIAFLLPEKRSTEIGCLKKDVEILRDKIRLSRIKLVELHSQAMKIHETESMVTSISPAA